MGHTNEKKDYVINKRKGAITKKVFSLIQLIINERFFFFF